MHLKVCGVAVIIQNFKALLNSFIDDVLKYKAGLQLFQIHMHYYVFLSDESLLTKLSNTVTLKLHAYKFIQCLTQF